MEYSTTPFLQLNCASHSSGQVRRFVPQLAVIHRLGDCFIAARDVLGGIEELTELIDYVTKHHPEIIGLYRELVDMQQPKKLAAQASQHSMFLTPQLPLESAGSSASLLSPHPNASRRSFARPITPTSASSTPARTRSCLATCMCGGCVEAVFFS